VLIDCVDVADIRQTFYKRQLYPIYLFLKFLKEKIYTLKYLNTVLYVHITLLYYIQFNESLHSHGQQFSKTNRHLSPPLIEQRKDHYV
jgi:hypothetical protein